MKQNEIFRIKQQLERISEKLQIVELTLQKGVNLHMTHSQRNGYDLLVESFVSDVSHEVRMIQFAVNEQYEKIKNADVEETPF